MVVVVEELPELVVVTDDVGDKMEAVTVSTVGWTVSTLAGGM